MWQEDSLTGIACWMARRTIQKGDIMVAWKGVESRMDTHQRINEDDFY